VQDLTINGRSSIIGIIITKLSCVDQFILTTVVVLDIYTQDYIRRGLPCIGIESSRVWSPTTPPPQPPYKKFLIESNCQPFEKQKEYLAPAPTPWGLGRQGGPSYLPLFLHHAPLPHRNFWTTYNSD
jgi:hypothetical protein